MIDSKVLAFGGVALMVTLTPGAEMILLATIHLLEGVLWLSMVIAFMGQMWRLFSRPSVQRNVEAVVGVILIGLGLRLAIEQR